MCTFKIYSAVFSFKRLPIPPLYRLPVCPSCQSIRILIQMESLQQCYLHTHNLNSHQSIEPLQHRSKFLTNQRFFNTELIDLSEAPINWLCYKFPFLRFRDSAFIFIIPFSFRFSTSSKFNLCLNLVECEIFTSLFQMVLK